jgi:phosphoribosyl-ATP pyrophosphohydrolase/phosphoribosyl-AMP cyclohydrolase
MNLDFKKYADGLIPAIVQDATTGTVLMLGFMNAAAIARTKESGHVTFFSRSKNRLWTKGEESGNYLKFVSMKSDCDNDTLLLSVHPTGPVCHKGTASCWGETNDSGFRFLTQLEQIIEDRNKNLENADSYVASLFRSGVNKIAQKVGEEAVELVIEAMDDNKDRFLEEAADLLFHSLILLQEKGFRLADVEQILKSRHLS